MAAICRKCDEPKVDTDFYTKGGGRRDTTCKTCRCVQQRARDVASREADIDSHRALRRSYARSSRDKDQERAKRAARRRTEHQYVTIEGRAIVMLNACRQRAKTQGVGFSLTKAWVVAKLATGTCERTGLPLDLQVGLGKQRIAQPFSPSVDRVRSRGDYSPENCQMVVFIYNFAKFRFSDADVLRMALALVTHP